MRVSDRIIPPPLPGGGSRSTGSRRGSRTPRRRLDVRDRPRALKQTAPNLSIFSTNLKRRNRRLRHNWLPSLKGTQLNGSLVPGPPGKNIHSRTAWLLNISYRELDKKTRYPLGYVPVLAAAELPAAAVGQGRPGPRELEDVDADGLRTIILQFAYTSRFVRVILAQGPC